MQKDLYCLGPIITHPVLQKNLIGKIFLFLPSQNDFKTNYCSEPLRQNFQNVLLVQPKFATSEKKNAHIFKLLLYVTETSVYLVNEATQEIRRSKQFAFLKNWFFSQTRVSQPKQNHGCHLFQGELLVEPDQYINSTYVAYDYLIAADKNISMQPFPSRMKSLALLTADMPQIQDRALFRVTPAVSIQEMKYVIQKRNDIYYVQNSPCADFRFYCHDRTVFKSDWVACDRYFKLEELETFIQEWRPLVHGELEVQFLSLSNETSFQRFQDYISKQKSFSSSKPVATQTIDSFFGNHCRYTQGEPEESLICIEKKNRRRSDWKDLNVRIQLKEEKNIQVTSFPKDKVAHWVRIKERNRYIYQEHFAYDFTRVFSGANLAEAQGQRTKQIPSSYEVELELLRSVLCQESNSNQKIAIYFLQCLQEIPSFTNT